MDAQLIAVSTDVRASAIEYGPIQDVKVAIEQPLVGVARGVALEVASGVQDADDAFRAPVVLLSFEGFVYIGHGDATVALDVWNAPRERANEAFFQTTKLNTWYFLGKQNIQ